ncbi:MAG: hypothetical protein J2P16_08405, partial [Mycobacterium sp.]|nr:hypothetical protein [Mycobacterium sp.]
MTPLTPPPARADVVDAVIDQIVAPFMDAATNTLNWDAFLTPAAWDAFLTPAHWDAVFADLSSVGGGAAQATLSAPDLTALFEQSVYAPMHTDIENWINSSVGQQVDGFINTALGSYAIGNGTAGTEADPTGGAGGWLFGDGGPGWN